MSEASKKIAAEQADINRRLAIENAIAMLQRALPGMTPDERLEVWYQLRKDYCTACGGNNPHCRCWDDMEE